MIKLSDYIFKYLADYGMCHIFMLTGGGAMHLNDSIRKEKRLHYICNHHEQACAMAAEGYARITGKLGVINTTSGPGGINALNGVFGRLDRRHTDVGDLRTDQKRNMHGHV